MNQLAAFFAQMTSPTTATAGARVQAGAPQGDAFANILAQFQASLLSDGAAIVDPAAGQQQIQSTAATQFLAQLPQPANLTTDDLAAQLKALAGAGGDTSKIDALLALLAPQQTTTQSVQPQQAVEAPIDATLAGIIAALQQQIQTQTPQPTTEPGALPAAPAVAATSADVLRGSIPIEAPADQPQTPRTPDASKAVDAKTAQAVENAAIALIVPPTTRTKPGNEQATPNTAAPVSAKATSKQQPDNTVAQAAEQQSGKQAQTASQEAGAQSSAASKPQTDQATPTQSKPSDAPAPQQTSTAAAVPAPSAPILTGAPNVTIAAVAAQTAVPLDALAVHIARKFEAGASQFEINLHPADLGRVDITLSVSEDGHVQAVLRAERPETLDLLQRDARSLEQQLRQAGLDVGAGALSFSLSSGSGQRQAPFAGWPAFAQAQDDADGAAKQQAASTYFAVRQQGGVDIRV